MCIMIYHVLRHYDNFRISVCNCKLEIFVLIPIQIKKKTRRAMIGVVIFKAAFIKHYDTCIHPCTMYDENLLLLFTIRL